MDLWQRIPLVFCFYYVWHPIGSSLQFFPLSGSFAGQVLAFLGLATGMAVGYGCAMLALLLCGMIPSVCIVTHLRGVKSLDQGYVRQWKVALFL